ncbi:MAG: hypothetical protein ACO35F_08040, partial [Ilumatobacteraceae bacterium]
MGQLATPSATGTFTEIVIIIENEIIGGADRLEFAFFLITTTQAFFLLRRVRFFAFDFLACRAFFMVTTNFGFIIYRHFGSNTGCFTLQADSGLGRRI